MRRSSGGIALVAVALSIAACDRQKAADPQPKTAVSSAAEAPTAATSAATSSRVQRFTIDYSHAGAAIPDADVRGPDGQTQKLSTLKGKPLLINLWATWCAPCVEELPTLDRLARDVGTRGHVVALSQDMGADAATITGFLTQRGLTAIASWRDPDNAVGLVYGGALPTTLVYDAEGKEVGRVTGPVDWSGPEGAEILRKAGFPN